MASGSWAWQGRRSLKPHASRPCVQATQRRLHQEIGASDAIIHAPCSRGRTQTRRPTLSTLLAQPAGVATDPIHDKVPLSGDCK
jgi:hypothetical protein